MAVGNRHLGYKEALNDIEDRSPGSKFSFVHKFWSNAHEAFAGEAEEARDDLQPCSVCGAPTPGRTDVAVCAFCRMRARAVGEPIAIRET